MSRKHQIGYMEAKAVRLLDGARKYVVTPDEDGQPKTSWGPLGCEKLWHDQNAKRAWEIINAAYENAKQVRKIALQLQRGY